MERRNAERRRFTHTVECEFDAAESGEAGNRTYMAQAQDICTHGVGLEADWPLIKGMILRLGLPVIEVGTLLPVFAEVAWAVPSGNRIKAGLRFLR